MMKRGPIQLSRLARPGGISAVTGWLVVGIVAALIVGLGGAGESSHAAGMQAEFTPFCTIVSNPAVSLPDPEFDDVSFRVTWQDRNGDVYVADVDPVTGDILFGPDGLGERIGRGAVSLEVSRNGPEWTQSAGGSQVLYSFLAGGSVYIARAFESNGSWTTVLLEDSKNRTVPSGSLSRFDPDPLVAYFVLTPRRSLTGVRQIDDASTEHLIQAQQAGGARFFPDQRSFIVTMTVGETRQVARVDADTGEVSRLTFDNANKENCRPWYAPELAGELLITCGVEEGAFARVYRKRPDSDVWQVYNDIPNPSLRPYVSEARPFAYQGRSYVVLLTTESLTGKLRLPSDVWIAATDPAAPFYRRITSPVSMSRYDTEVLITAEGPVVYFSEIRWDDPSLPCDPGESQPVCRSVIHKCRTGL